MGTETITTIVVSLIGGLVIILIGALGHLITKNQAALDKRLDNQDSIALRQAENSAKHAELIGQLGGHIKELGLIIGSIKDHFALRHDAVEARLKEHHEEIEMLRSRTHDDATDINWVIGELKKHKLLELTDRPKRTFAAIRPRRDN